MAHDDRNLNFEKALARHLHRRSASMDSHAADSAPVSGASRDTCPDPETLAAYHDGSLTLDELSFWKQHVVGCNECQLVLAHLATPLDRPVNIDLPADTLPLRPAASTAAVANKVRALDVQTVAAKRPPSMRWVWLFPSGALAAGLIAWIAIQQQKPAALAPVSSVEVAENRPSTGSSPQSQSASADAISTNESAREKDQPISPSRIGAAGGNSKDRDYSQNDLRKQSELAQRSDSDLEARKIPGSQNGALKQDGQRVGTGSGAGNGPAVASGSFDQKKLETLSAPKPVARLRQEAVNPPPAPPAALEQANGKPVFMDGSPAAAMADTAPAAPAPAPALVGGAVAPKVKTDSANRVSSAAESVEVSSEAQASSQIHALEGKVAFAALVADPHVFSSPDGKQIWRVGVGGLLEHSTNRGGKWSLQATGVSTDLLAGSAPSAKVSWIVGRSGTILRTTNGGSHWTRLVSPVPNDLTGIHATDVMHATIYFTLDPSKGVTTTYVTNDGGLTWTLTNE